MNSMNMYSSYITVTAEGKKLFLSLLVLEQRVP